MTRLGRRQFGAGAAAAAAVALAGVPASVRASPWPPGSLRERPLVIAHRGASAYRPEHTLAAYDLAIAMGADFIEPDLVAAKDGVLVARHEPWIGETTDVAAKFPERRTRRTVDGKEIDDWFVTDFTLAEIRTLRAVQPQKYRGDGYDGAFGVPTLEEIIELAQRRGTERGRPVGLYPETKHPSFFRAAGLPLEERLVALLHARGYRDAAAPALIQSFETANLKALAGMTRLRLVQLLGGRAQRPWDLAAAGDARTYGDLMRPEELRAVARYAFAIGPGKRAIVPAGPDGRLLPPTSLVADAHAAGLAVHAYTFRDEPRHLAPDYASDPVAEYLHFFGIGVDGVFSDNPDTALRARALVSGRR